MSINSQSNSQQQLSTSQRSHHSNASNGSQHSNRQQQQQRMVNIQALSQSHKKAMDDVGTSNKVKNDDPLVGNLLEENSQNLQLDALDGSIDGDNNDEVLELPEELGSIDQPLTNLGPPPLGIIPKQVSENSEDKDPINPQPPSLNESSSNKRDLPSGKNSNQSLDDNSEKSLGLKSKKRKTTAGVDKNPRGRGGGKGKRLREIQKINLNNESESGNSGSITGIKRTADEISKNKNDASPDTASSGAAKKGGGQPSLPKGDVEQHLLMLNKGLHLTSRTITHKCLPIVQQLIDDPYGWVFRDAVDPVLFGLPDYFEVVKNPMHLLLVKKKLENAVYTDMASFERDVKLVFENAILYNGEESDVGTLAKTMKGVFETEYKKVCEGM
uniref:Bromo domain-containing protein n=1 Tax=Pseudo-nitzschia australis TaxID=44445 RepID=A0A7S4EN26_9STRA